MNISNDATPTDYVEYIAKQLPKDLAQYVKLRDELAKRQGALSAAEAALADREKARGELAAAQAQAPAAASTPASPTSPRSSGAWACNFAIKRSITISINSFPSNRTSN